MKPQLSLGGVRVQLAGSVPMDASQEQADGIRAFVRCFAAAVLREGGTLVHGSHPTLIEPLKAAADAWVRADGRRDALTLVRAHKYAVTDAEKSEIGAQRQYAAVQIIPSLPGNSMENLVPMREWMAERCDVVVAVGGNWYQENKSRAGVPVELEETLSRGKPAFVVAGFGGAVAGYLKDDESLLSRLRNGLFVDQNRSLSATVNPEELTHRIISQIAMLPLVKGNVTSGRMFRILSLDGGGLRGAFTAAVLAKWAEMLGVDAGESLVKHFDLVAGTSTGAILAIGLAVGLPPSQILKFYREQGAKIFPKNRALRHWLKSKHDSQTLRTILSGILGDKQLTRDACCRLVIPTVRAQHGEADVIVTAHTPDRTGFVAYTAVEAALASSAAPTYFDEAVVAGSVAVEQYLDGGIWANNPVLPAIAEAVGPLGIPIDRIDVLSVGTMGNEADFTGSLGKGKAGWAPASADLFFAAQETAATRLADFLLTRSRHLRINQQVPSPVMLDDVEALEDLTVRGSRVGQDSFVDVRSRFLDGFHVPDWRNSGIAD